MLLNNFGAADDKHKARVTAIFEGLQLSLEVGIV
jgi:hypothetical protein